MKDTSISNMKFSIVIPTYNRSEELERTLESLRGLQVRETWEVIVVDNNSSDDTKEVILEAAKTFPAELRYVYEKEQGRSAAMNAGINASHGEIIAVTDDDVRVDPHWVTNAESALERFACDYVGGKALPIWGGTRPDWLPDRPAKLWAVIALLDYGPTPVEFGEQQVPLGVNMVFRRDAFVRAGLWDNAIGRKGATLMGQEVREWSSRARTVGLRGFYSPDLIVHHVIPPDRLTKNYFRRWFYWHGISRAILYETKGLDMESPERKTLNFSEVPHIAGVPRYLYRTFISRLVAMSVSVVKGNVVESFEHELWLWFFAGILKRRLKVSMSNAV